MNERRRSFEELFQAAKLLELQRVIEDRGIAVKGRRFACPWCQHLQACKIIAPELRGWYCHQCQKGGDAVTLIQAWEAEDEKIGTRTLERLQELTGRELVNRVPQEERKAASKPAPEGLTPEQIGRLWNLWRVQPGGARTWLETERGIPQVDLLEDSVGRILTPGSVPGYRADVRRAAESDLCAVFPLRTTDPERLGQVWNLAIRPRGGFQDERGGKTRNLNWGTGTGTDGDWPLCYGDPAVALQQPVVVLLEGAIDWATAAALSRWLRVGVLGAFASGDIERRWASVLRPVLEDGRQVAIVQQLDLPNRNGQLVGPAACRALAERLLGGEFQQLLWPWVRFLRKIGAPMAGAFKDLNDLVRPEPKGLALPWSRVRDGWREILGGV